MGMIGRWIDQMCEREPDVMRRVYRRPFGKLERFLDADGTCGCLIGSAHLEGASFQWSGYRPMWGLDENVIGHEVFGLTLWRGDYEQLDVRVKRPDAFVIRALKNRIRKRLGISITEPAPEVSEVSR